MVTPARDEAAVRGALARVARRLWLWRLLRRGLRVAAGASALVAALLVARALGPAPDLRDGRVAAGAAAALGLLLVVGLRRATPAQAARVVDATYGLGERFTTAVECLGQGGAMQRLVVRDAARCAAGLDLRRLPRARVGRDAWSAAACLAAAAVLWLQPAVPSLSAPAGPGSSRGQAPAAGEAPGAPPPGAASKAPEPGSGEAVPGGLRAALGLDPEKAPTASALSQPPVAPDRGERAGAAPPRGAQRAEAQGRSGAPGTEIGQALAPSAAAAGASVREGAAAPAGPEGVASGGEGPGRAIAAAGPGAGAGQAGDGIAAPARGASPAPPANAAPTSPEAVGTEARPVFTRAPVPPAVREYILRYFQELRAAPKGENPS